MSQISDKFNYLLSKSSRWRRRLLIFIAVFGPATITAMADNDAAGVATYSLAGAKFGYSILFVLLLITLLLAITQEMGVRIAIVTGKGLGDLIRERYGIKLSIVVFSVLFIANLGTIVADFSALKTTAEIFNIPALPVVVGMSFLAFLFVSKGSYKTNQNIFLISALFYLVYIISAFKASPDWLKAITSTISPLGIPLSKEFIYASIAVLGTTITPWGQFFVHSYVIDKKLSVDKLKYEQWETYFGAFLTNFFSFFMIVATAAVLFTNGIPLISGEQAALAIKPFAGELASFLFAIGLFNAGFMGIVIISLSTAYAFAEFFGIEGSLDVSFEQGKTFYILFAIQLAVAAFLVLLPSVSLFKIVLYTQSLNGILLPVIFYFLLKITNDKDLMGNYINGKFYNYFAVISSIVIIFAALFSILTSIIHF